MSWEFVDGNAASLFVRNGSQQSLTQGKVLLGKCIVTSELAHTLVGFLISLPIFLASFIRIYEAVFVCLGKLSDRHFVFAWTRNEWIGGINKVHIMLSRLHIPAFAVSWGLRLFAMTNQLFVCSIHFYARRFPRDKSTNLFSHCTSPRNGILNSTNHYFKAPKSLFNDVRCEETLEICVRHF